MKIANRVDKIPVSRGINEKIRTKASSEIRALQSLLWYDMEYTELEKRCNLKQGEEIK